MTKQELDKIIQWVEENSYSDKSQYRESKRLVNAQKVVDYLKKEFEIEKKPDETPMRYVMGVPVDRYKEIWSQENLNKLEKRNSFLCDLLNNPHVEKKDEKE